MGKEPGRHQDLLGGRAVVIEMARDVRASSLWPGKLRRIFTFGS